ncbi:MAG TPA: hypothetical protein VMU36_11685 [Spirochaetia bacterium]|nr:hypothetical protein [Spirochaetia bacterium]
MGETMCTRCRHALDEKDVLSSMTRTCGQCFGILLSERDEKLTSYLDSFAAPAALLAPDHTVLASNHRFQSMAFDHDVVGLRVGEALDCMYTSTLGRCGETIACLLCHLKRSVAQTLLTGHGLQGVSMSYPHKMDSRKTVTVMTEKVGDAVLLMIGPPPGPEAV